MKKERAETRKFYFLTVKAIHKDKKEQERDLRKLFRSIEDRPVDISKPNHRYINLSQDTFGLISGLEFYSNGIILKLRKCNKKDIFGSFLNDGEKSYNIGEVLDNYYKRDDVVPIEENQIKIFDDDAAII